jgi:hypothetical protein
VRKHDSQQVEAGHDPDSSGCRQTTFVPAGHRRLGQVGRSKTGRTTVGHPYSRSPHAMLQPSWWKKRSTRISECERDDRFAQTGSCHVKDLARGTRSTQLVFPSSRHSKNVVALHRNHRNLSICIAVVKHHTANSPLSPRILTVSVAPQTRLCKGRDSKSSSFGQRRSFRVRLDMLPSCSFHTEFVVGRMWRRGS